MKSSIIIAAPLLASAAVLHPRQKAGLSNFETIAKTASSPAVAVAGVDVLKPQTVKVKEVQRTLTRLGPLKLDGAKTGPASAESGHSHSGGGPPMSPGMGFDSTLAGQDYFLNIANGICSNKGGCTVVAGKTGVLFANGTAANPANGIYIHHILTADRMKKDVPFLSSCDNPDGPNFDIGGMGVGQGFVGTGEDTGDAFGIFTNAAGSMGYHVKEGDQFTAWAKLVNYNKEDVDVLLTYDLEWLPGLVGEDVRGVLIGIQLCPSRKINLDEKGPAKTRTGNWTVLENGSFVFGRGHLHDGGESVTLVKNNRPICVSKAQYGGDRSTTSLNGQQWQTISGMSECTKPIPVKKGDTIALDILYDLKKYPLRKTAGGGEADVMGMYVTAFVGEKKETN